MSSKAARESLTVEHLLFNVASYTTMVGWALLAVVPQWEHTYTATRLIQLFNALIYGVALITGALKSQKSELEEINFMTLKGVIAIYRRGHARVLLACWVHYLSYDLFVGELVTRDALQIGISQLAMAPVLFSLLMFGPFGFVSYAVVRVLYTSQPFLLPWW